MARSLAALVVIAGLALATYADAMQAPPAATALLHEDATPLPQRPPAKRPGGRTKMKCTVQADGKFTECELIFECPKGFGYGKAALDAARYFKMRPKTVDGAPVAGGKVVVPIRWDLDGLPPPPECEEPQSAPTKP